jgi:nitroimidazol reductase NimA-like FMN-containing flavoprotein (pyridoxamine 5'-phosphate oxidase superfamily)
VALTREPPTASAAKDFEDIHRYTLDDDAERQLLDEQTECTFMWTTRDGQPVGVIVNYIFREGRFWLTAASRRARIAAVRRDPRVCIAVSSKGSGITERRSLSYTGTCVLHDDAETKRWFYPDFAAAMRPGEPARAAEFAGMLDSPGRLVLEVLPARRIGYDGAKMWAAAPAAAPAL